jgi:phosphoglycerate kinase
VLLLENLRFHAEEEKNDPGFARALAALADVYVNDAFGAAHRAHASTTGMAALIPARAAGFLMRDEVRHLGKLLAGADRPFVAILGGAKVSDKIAVIENLLAKVDALLIGGAMAYTFLRARGVEVGASRVEADKVEVARSALDLAAKRGVRLLLPTDHVAARKPEAGSESQVCGRRSPPAGSASTSGRRHARPTRARSLPPARSSGTARWESSRSGVRRRHRGGGARPWRRRPRP